MEGQSDAPGPGAYQADRVSWPKRRTWRRHEPRALQCRPVRGSLTVAMVFVQWAFATAGDDFPGHTGGVQAAVHCHQRCAPPNVRARPPQSECVRGCVLASQPPSRCRWCRRPRVHPSRPRRGPTTRALACRPCLRGRTACPRRPPSLLHRCTLPLPPAALRLCCTRQCPRTAPPSCLPSPFRRRLPPHCGRPFV